MGIIARRAIFAHFGSSLFNTAGNDSTTSSINPPSLLKADEARLSLLGARLFVALRGETKPVGWLALGTPLSGEVYTPKDLDFLDNLSDQASVAISRVQTVVDLDMQ
jgi:GAF domain-containing protein